jgi:hypothetical protein
MFGKQEGKREERKDEVHTKARRHKGRKERNEKRENL